MISWLFPKEHHAQSTGEILATTIESFRPGQSWSASFQGMQGAGLPWVQKIELRSELDRLLFSRQEFLARATFYSPGQRKAEKSKSSAYAAWKSSEQINLWKPVLLHSYKNLIRLQFSIKEVQLVEEELLWLKREDSLYQVVAASGREIDIAAYIKMLQERSEIQNQRIMLQNKIHAAATIAGMGHTAVREDPLWCTPKQMVAVVDSLQVTHELPAVFEGAYLDASASLVRAENKRWIDFLQTRYSVRDDLFLQNRFSIGLGLTIPWNGATSLKLRELSFRTEQLAEEVRAMHALRSKKLLENKELFSAAMMNYMMFSSGESDKLIAELKMKYLSSDQADPIKWVQLQRQELKKIRLQHKELQNLWDLYLEILDVSGALYARPFRNYFYGSHILIQSMR